MVRHLHLAAPDFYNSVCQLSILWTTIIEAGTWTVRTRQTVQRSSPGELEAEWNRSFNPKYK